MPRKLFTIIMYYCSIYHCLFLRGIQNDWWRKKADDLQQYADKHDSQSFYDALKAVYGPKCASASPLKTADGSQFITDEEAILSRWRDHFDALLNRPSVVKPGTIEGLQQAAVFTNWTTYLAKKRSVRQYIKQNQEKPQDRTAYLLKFSQSPNQFFWTGFYLSSHKSGKLKSCHKISKTPR